MCRNIKRLHNYQPPATAEEIHAAALQYVRKVSGMTRPSEANADAFERAVEEVAAITRRLILDELETRATPRDRDEDNERAKQRGREREQRLLQRLAEQQDQPAG